MSAIISFLVGCVMLAVCFIIGAAILQFGLTVGWLLIVGIFAGIGWLWQKLTGN